MFEMDAIERDGYEWIMAGKRDLLYRRPYYNSYIVIIYIGRRGD